MSQCDMTGLNYRHYDVKKFIKFIFLAKFINCYLIDVKFQHKIIRNLLDSIALFVSIK